MRTWDASWTTPSKREKKRSDRLDAGDWSTPLSLSTSFAKGGSHPGPKATPVPPQRDLRDRDTDENFLGRTPAQLPVIRRGNVNMDTGESTGRIRRSADVRTGSFNHLLFFRGLAYIM
jgi:hypothetical protein